MTGCHDHTQVGKLEVVDDKHKALQHHINRVEQFILKLKCIMDDFEDRLDEIEGYD